MGMVGVGSQACQGCREFLFQGIQQLGSAIMNIPHPQHHSHTSWDGMRCKCTNGESKLQKLKRPGGIAAQYHYNWPAGPIHREGATTDIFIFDYLSRLWIMPRGPFLSTKDSSAG